MWHHLAKICDASFDWEFLAATWYGKNALSLLVLQTVQR